jgi:uncharacterized phage protein gp47/JayE
MFHPKKYLRELTKAYPMIRRPNSTSTGVRKRRKFYSMVMLQIHQLHTHYTPSEAVGATQNPERITFAVEISPFKKEKSWER